MKSFEKIYGIKPKFDHSLAVIDGTLADDFARRNRSSEPDGNQGQNKIRKIARLIFAHYEINHNGDDRCLRK